MLRAPTRSSKKGLSRFRIPILVCSSLALLAITLHLWSTPLQGGVQTLSDRWYQTSHHPQNYAIPPPNSHAYLKHSVPPSAMAGQYHTNLTYQDTLLSRTSQYKSFIDSDLQPWAASGITQELLGFSTAMSTICETPMARIQISRGSLWVTRLDAPNTTTDQEWRNLDYVLLGIMDALSVFGAQIPDVDAVVHAGDVPCMRKKWMHGGPPQVLLGVQGSVRHFDVPLPDYTLWVDELQLIQGVDGEEVVSWQEASHLMQEKYSNTSLLVRVPQAMWRGDVLDAKHPERGQLRRAFSECGRRMSAEERPSESVLFNVQHSPVALQEVCDFRYDVHVEALGVSRDLKHKLACGSLVVAFRMEYWEFWTRGLQPGRDYVQLTNEEDHVCNETAAAVRDMNTLFSTVGQSALRGPKQETPSLARALAELRRSPGAAALLAGASEDDVPAPDANGTYSWGSAATPWEIAWAGYDFLHGNVRLEDAVVYTRDLLAAYAALQDFKVKPQAGAACFNGPRLLERLGGAGSARGKRVAAAHPWLADYDGNCHAAEKYWDDIK
ncbi:hypothetical protein APUTEX25_003596 [Auxenochlorella protothecoides]|uniref:Glycosyl transferase CAP10 domain-containing protein n=1 Tax=Auxenochlorella protothecoides TaxID=3075 RepID=A0A1D2ABH0_AUXPR|nr:hypothetical protein APUTEX25_003596 [Auxenochlorella protothecoides]|eukprot:RMZ57139.1 hypothetical protein APUTEX25_003596 [Auxenochlorella protothecoides]